MPKKKRVKKVSRKWAIDTLNSLLALGRTEGISEQECLDSFIESLKGEDIIVARSYKVKGG